MAHEQHLYVAGFFMVICCLACAVCIEEQLQNFSSWCQRSPTVHPQSENNMNALAAPMLIRVNV